MYVMILLLNLILIAQNALAKPSNDSNLLLVQVITRHGARTPFYASYPNDPNTEFLAFGKNQLTKNGTLEMFEIGKQLRRRYNGFLKNDYRTVLAQSSYASRCIQSGQALLAAIYPSTLFSEQKNQNESSLVQPVPLYSAPPQCDGMLDESRLQKILGDYEAFFNKLYSKPVVQKLERDVEAITGIKNVTVNELYGLADLLIIEKYHNKTLPPWYDTIHSRLDSFYTGYFTGIASNMTVAKALAGKLLNETVTNLEFPKLTKETNIPIDVFYYITHDVNLSSFLGLLSVPLDSQPPFGATVLIEKYQSSNGAVFVKFFYLASSTSVPIELKLPGCVADCTIQELKNIVYKINSNTK